MTRRWSLNYKDYFFNFRRSLNSFPGCWPPPDCLLPLLFLLLLPLLLSLLLYLVLGMEPRAYTSQASCLSLSYIPNPIASPFLMPSLKAVEMHSETLFPNKRTSR
jgi:hypothetical protein